LRFSATIGIARASDKQIRFLFAGFRAVHLVPVCPHSFTAALFAAGSMLAVSGFGYLIVLRRIEPMKADPEVPEGAIVPAA
jgi:hypothetical protein